MVAKCSSMYSLHSRPTGINMLMSNISVSWVLEMITAMAVWRELLYFVSLSTTKDSLPMR